MSEIKIKLDEIHPVEILGSNNEKLKIIQEAFPKLKIHARGNELKIQGDTSEIERLDEKLNRMINHVLRHDQLPENRLVEIIESEQPGLKNGSKEDKSDVLVHGNHGLVIRTKTINQQKLYQATQDNDLVFATGPAGTGKTYTSVAIAVRALKNKEVKKIILTRPAVEAGESLGFLPGDISEKVDPYLQPLYDALYDMIPGDKLREYLENKTIEIAP
ncbi:MAG: phosphate starvation-inducible protein PhoH, partial [Bacteroidetes bacterium SW_10_40_5]